MTYAATLPRSDAALDTAGNKVSREYFRFFGDLARVNAANGELPARVDALDVRVRTLEEHPASATGRVLGPQSVRVDGLLSNGVATVRLVGDINQPAALSFYGALTLGGRGWQNLAPESFEARDNGDGTLTLDLATLTATALTDLTYPCVVSLDGAGNAYTPDLTNAADVSRIVGVTSHAAAAGAPVRVVTSRDFTESAWNWSPGRIYCALTGGALTQTAPATGAVVEVARVITPTTIRVGIQPAILR